MDAPASNPHPPPQGTPRPGIHIPPHQGKVVDVPNPDHLSPGIPPSLPKQGKAVDVPNPNPDPVLFPDIPPSLPHLPVPDTVGAPHTSDSVPPSSSTATDTATHDTETSSPAPAPAPSPSTTTNNTPRPSPTPAPTTSSIPPSDSEPSPADSETVHLSTRIVSSSSRFIRPTVPGSSTFTVPNDDLIPSSSSLIYPTDNGSQGSNPNNVPVGGGNVGGGGGNPSKAAEQRGLSTGAVAGIVISMIILCFVGFVFWRRRQRQARRTDHANRWWFSRTRQLPEGYMYNAPERPPTVYSSSFGSSFERTRSNSLMSSDEFDGSSTRPPMMEVNPFATTTTTPSLSLGATSHSPADSDLYGPHSLTTIGDSQFFAHPDSESSYNETILPSSVHLPSSPPSESSTIHPQRPPSPKYNSSSFSRTSSGRSLALLPNSPTTRVFIPPIPPLPKSPPPIPMSNPFMDHNPFEDPVHH
ncbi:hypothetical protein M413DRAFT_445883 [Hebeloma cylindrosporum]|uniref:Uncharacterized protein n=1 Tax=Hebeloma cylindrosporum TaxID=76867 RepID=A0A0C2YJI7_HEBCY|nr:hypothetical protein M413DRAFT_445883 [Hebeloma cylindrosporum h7]